MAPGSQICVGYQPYGANFVRKNALYVLDDVNFSPPAIPTYWVCGAPNPCVSGQVCNVVDAWDYNLNIYVAAVFAMEKRMPGPAHAGDWFWYVFQREPAPPPPATQTSYTEWMGWYPMVHIDETMRQKYLVSHEYGHALLMNNINYDDTHPIASSCSGGSCYPCDYSYGLSDHSFISAEWQSAAGTEGFAHWVSAATWNYSDTDGQGYVITAAPNDPAPRGNMKIFSVEIGNVCGAVDWDCNAQNNCYVDNPDTCPGTNYYLHRFFQNDPGLATEYDWLRQYWDYRTDSGSKPTHDQLISELVDAHLPWDTRYSYYIGIKYGVVAARRSRFDGLAHSNGVDW